MATPKSEGPGVSLQSAAKGVTNIGKQGIATRSDHEVIKEAVVAVLGCRSGSCSYPDHNKLYEARVEAQLRPMQRGLGELRGAIGTQGYDRRLSAEGEDGILLPPAHTQSIAAFIFEELQL